MATPQLPDKSATSPLAETAVPGGRGQGDLEGTHVMSQEAASQPSPSGNKAAPGDPATASARPKTYSLGDFELRKELGQGGMGKVYLAHQISLDRPCAVKLMSNELAKKPGFVHRFVREARSMARIDHPNVVKCYAVSEHEGKHFVAMELMDGQSMQDWLDQLGQLSIPDALHVTLVCADALRHAHGLNMIHRDIKPDNILVTKHGLVKVADFGLAKALDDDMSMTQSGTGLGTPHYMPPEQARNAKHVDNRCDIYALGCTLYHFVTGKLPFSGDTIVDLITNKEKGQFTAARRINNNVPERLDLIIDKMIARDPRHRYASCDEVIRDLEMLNLASDSLSFINSDQKVVMRRGGPATSVPAGTPTLLGDVGRAPSKGMPPTRALHGTSDGKSVKRRNNSPEDLRTSDKKDLWYVRHTDSAGKTKVSRMSTQQIKQAMKSDQLDLRTRITRDPKQGDFLPLAQIPVFEDEAKRMVTRVKSQRRDDSLAEAYKKIEKQYDRQKWWRLLSRFRDGTLGMVGLILYLTLVAAVLVALFFGVRFANDYLRGTDLGQSLQGEQVPEE